VPSAGIGTLIALILPYCLSILVSWTRAAAPRNAF
jgi:p-aminobenzoyl-glutamate transporter AbgT